MTVMPVHLVRGALAALVLAGCTENHLHARHGSTKAVADTAAAPDHLDPGGADTDTASPDTGDASTCDDVVLAGLERVAYDATCADAVSPTSSPWEAVVEGTWSTLPTAPDTRLEVVTTPIVADLNEDGVPDIITVASTDIWAASREGVLVVLDGVTRTPWLQVEGFDTYSTPTVGDVNGDGILDIVAMDRSMRARAVSQAGTDLWLSTDTTGLYHQHAHVTDLDGDGTAEVVFGQLILAGQTGATIAKLPHDTGTWLLSGGTVADLDLDGQQEVVHQGAVYDARGTLLWDMALGVRGPTHYAAIVQANDDPELELAIMSERVYTLFAHDGSVLATQAIAPEGDYLAQPAAADFDGDGVTELAIPTRHALLLAELDGTVYATHPTTDHSSAAGCSGFDFDADGAVEVVYADENNLFVFDGRTAEPRLVLREHMSGTGLEYPAIADVDADGSAEVIVASNQGGARAWSGITVVGHPTGNWADAGPDWHAYIRHDERFHTYNAKVAARTARPDLSVAVTDWCLPGCDPDDTLLMSLQVTNTGTADATDITVTVLADDGGTLTPVAEHVLDVSAATAGAGFELQVPVEALGTDGLRIAVDAADAILECDETDNRLTWSNACE